MAFIIYAFTRKLEPTSSVSRTGDSSSTSVAKTSLPSCFWFVYGALLRQSSILEPKSGITDRPIYNHKCTRGEGGKVRKMSHKNAIRHEKGDPPDFLTTPRTSLKRNWPKPKRTPPIFLYILYIYVYSE